METDKAPSSVVELEDCFAACATEGSAMFYPNYNDDMFDCRCNTPNTIQGASSTTCGPNVWFTFTHSADATASGLARRNLKDRLIALRRQSQTLCPKDAKACAIPGSETYEVKRDREHFLTEFVNAEQCIDTSTET
uniref:Uncharacterized protein n=1 Tax=Kwoniella bestiolae CBS 10118 TaxID=1296100 RepID=A0A1B9GCI4_9TREE|nr:hypothetical protein I302_00217 [Kwoniella bestiolae CBS 10118]OCF28728.1 hypothetical protein I302_00217 [Kwoniella bestiolae CBS 10118]